MTYQYIELKIKELEKRIKVLEQDHEDEVKTLDRIKAEIEALNPIDYRQIQNRK